VELVAPERHLRPPRGLLAWARGGRRGAGGPTPAADAAPAPDVELPLRGAGRTAALWTAVTLCWTLQVLVGEYADGGAAAVRATWRRDLVLQASVAVPWALLTPVVLRFARAVRVTRDRWAVPLAVHLAVAAALAPAELAVALAALGWKAPFLTAGTVNPLSLNVLIYVSLVAWVHARLFAAWYRERATAADRLAADLERTRLRTLAVEMNPDFVTALLEGCAALAPVRPAAAERLVERTAELLRAMLDAARARVPTLRAELALLRESLALLEAVTGRPARLHLDAPAAWAGAGVAGGGLRHALGLAALRAGAGGVDVVVAPAAPAPPERGAPRTGRAPLGRLAAWVAPRAADGSPADERACVAGTAGGAAAYAPTFAAAAAPAAAVAPGLPTPVLP
jgi:hypothetical protein